MGGGGGGELEHVPWDVSPGSGGVEVVGRAGFNSRCLRSVSSLTTKETGPRSPSTTDRCQGAGGRSPHARRDGPGFGGPLLPCSLGTGLLRAQPTWKLFCFGSRFIKAFLKSFSYP